MKQFDIIRAGSGVVLATVEAPTRTDRTVLDVADDICRQIAQDAGVEFCGDDVEILEVDPDMDDCE